MHGRARGWPTSLTFDLQVHFDPSEVTYEQLLDNFFDKVDPTTKDRQGNDMGTQYRSAIYYHNEQQKEAALKVLPSAVMTAFICVQHLPYYAEHAML